MPSLWFRCQAAEVIADDASGTTMRARGQEALFSTRYFVGRTGVLAAGCSGVLS